MEIESRVCPACHKPNDLGFKTCWRCGTPLEGTAGEQKPKAKRVPLTVVAFVIVLVLSVVYVSLSKSLMEFFFSGKKAASADISKEQKKVSPKPSNKKRAPAASPKKENKIPVSSVPVLAETYPPANKAGDYNLLVTSVPGGLTTQESENAYFEGLIGSYLSSHGGSTLLEKNGVMLYDKYRAVEYKIGFDHFQKGSPVPYVRHAITTVIANKAYTVSANYPRGSGGGGAAMRRKLINSLAMLEKPMTPS